jgi:hypothetical protein
MDIGEMRSQLQAAKDTVDEAPLAGAVLPFAERRSLALVEQLGQNLAMLKTMGVDIEGGRVAVRGIVQRADESHGKIKEVAGSSNHAAVGSVLQATGTMSREASQLNEQMGTMDERLGEAASHLGAAIGKLLGYDQAAMSGLQHLQNVAESQQTAKVSIDVYLEEGPR